MPEQIEQSVEVNGIGRHRGRLFQIRIYLVKFLRMFIYQNDWKVLPMAAAIGVIVAMVTRSNMFVTMEGTLVGSFAITLACVWNGCFNSIQVVCRERGIVKREHRSGMHISSYVCAHVIYQALLCLAQTILLMIVCVRAISPALSCETMSGVPSDTFTVSYTSMASHPSFISAVDAVRFRSDAFPLRTPEHCCAGGFQQSSRGIRVEYTEQYEKHGNRSHPDGG